MPSDRDVRADERLFALVLALTETTQGFTKQQILSTVHGYSERFAQESDHRALDRQFERDKEDLRDLGIPLETIEDPLDDGSNRHTRYRISQNEYRLPADVTFTPSELALLGLAASVWESGSMASDSRRALVKLRSLEVPVDEAPTGISPRVSGRGPVFEAVNDAIAKSREMTVYYRQPELDTLSTRRVSFRVRPLALVSHSGRWHVLSEDAAGVRSILSLSRIAAPPKLGQPFPAREGDHAAEALAELDEKWRAHPARVEVVRGSEAASRLSRRPGSAVTPGASRDVIETNFLDLHDFADELAGYGDAAVVTSPPALRSAVISRFESLAGVSS